jgi:hypothetical protein
MQAYRSAATTYSHQPCSYHRVPKRGRWPNSVPPLFRAFSRILACILRAFLRLRVPKLVTAFITEYYSPVHHITTTVLRNHTMINDETQFRWAVVPGQSILRSINPYGDPPIALDLDAIVTDIARPDANTELAIKQLQPEPEIEAVPDLEYTAEGLFRMTMHFHGNPNQVRDIRTAFRTKARSVEGRSLRQLCRVILGELSSLEAPGAKMDFDFGDVVFDWSDIALFLLDELSLQIPEGLTLGTHCFMSPCWVYSLCSRVDVAKGRYRRPVLSDQPSSRWRLTFVRASEQSARNLVRSGSSLIQAGEWAAEWDLATMEDLNREGERHFLDLRRVRLRLGRAEE